MKHAYKLSRFVELLEQQSSGASAPYAGFFALRPPADESCFSHLYQEWLSAFSYQPGRQDAIPPLLALARKLSKLSEPVAEDSLKLDITPEWQSLVNMRGPVESVQFRRCLACQQELPVMSTSGLYDAFGLVCPDCGSVYFRAYGDTTPLPPCRCGGHYPEAAQPGCPRCGAQENEPSREMSPYQYFADHPFLRGPNA